MRIIFKFIIQKRMVFLFLSGVSLYFLIGWLHISLWIVLLSGVLLGVIFGKVFCRWVCPMGLIMELMMGMSPDGKAPQMYQYHKIGCPIAWISGWLNRFSLFQIRLNEDTCKSCGTCDKQCYIVAMKPKQFSLFKSGMEKLGNSYTCSKCLQCVASCPNGSLKYRI